MLELQAEGDVIQCGHVTVWGQLEFVQEMARLLDGVRILLSCFTAVPFDGAEETCNEHQNALMSNNISAT